MITGKKTRYERDREARQRLMRGRILKAAMKLFLKKGYDNVTMRKIASEIGYTPGTIYRYFADKDEIFFALRGEGFELFYQAQISARKSQNPEQRMRDHAEAYVEFALAHPEYYELMFLTRAPVERAAERKEWADTVKSLDLLREDVQEAMEAGIIRRDNVDKVAVGLWSILHGVMTLIMRRRMLLHTTLSDRELAYKTIEFILENTIIRGNDNKSESNHQS